MDTNTESIIGDLTLREKMIIWTMREGTSLNKIATALGMSQAWLGQAYARGEIPQDYLPHLRALGIPEELLPRPLRRAVSCRSGMRRNGRIS